MSASTLRLQSFLLLVVFYGVYVVGRERRYLEVWSFLLLVVLYGVYVVWRERRYLEAWVFSSSGGFVWPVRSRA